MKNKKGVWAMRVIAGIVILLLSAWAILFVFNNTAFAAQGKSQTETCRFSNAIKVGLEEKSGGWATGARLCSTIDKTEGDSQVPTENYPQDAEGAAAEIREMIANCWYMWLEGSEPNTFKKFANTETCFVCYMFKIKEDIKDIKHLNFDTIAASMNEPYRVGDNEEWCAINGGFLEEKDNACGTGEYNLGDPEGWKETSSKKAVSEGRKCCIRKDVTNVCENKGGKCSSEGASTDYPKLYLKWSCLGDQKCYVKEGNMETYAQYITKNNGDLYFIPPQDATNNRGYETEKEYAISFVSPSMQCEGIVCRTKYFFAVGVVKLPDYLKVWGLQQLGLHDLAVKKEEEIGEGIYEYEPNFMIISSLGEAQNLGCTIE